MPSVTHAHLVSLLEPGEATSKLALWAGLLGAVVSFVLGAIQPAAACPSKVLAGLGGWHITNALLFFPSSRYTSWASSSTGYGSTRSQSSRGRLPWLSDVPFLYRQHILGSFVPDSPELHRKYGKIIRVGPNRLALEGSIAWNDVFAHRPGGDATEFGKIPGFFFPGDRASLINAPTRDDHRRQRRQLSHAFSEAAMAEQAPIIMFYIDLFLQRLKENSVNGGAVDMLKWLNFVTFDIIGDLGLGESFHSLENSDYHPWVLNIFNGIRGGNKLRFVNAIWPALGGPYARLESEGTIKATMDNLTYAREKAGARAALGPEPQVASREQVVGLDGKTRKMTVRRDFMTYMMRNGAGGSTEKPAITREEILNNAFVLITAGSETTGTNLSTLFFLLALPSNRVYRDAVAAEVRNAFRHGSEMDLVNVNSKALPLLHACIEEALRFHPPVSLSPARVSPGATVGGHYLEKGVSG